MFGFKGYLVHKILFQSFGWHLFKRVRVRELVELIRNSLNNHPLGRIVF